MSERDRAKKAVENYLQRKEEIKGNALEVFIGSEAKLVVVATEPGMEEKIQVINIEKDREYRKITELDLVKKVSELLHSGHGKSSLLKSDLGFFLIFYGRFLSPVRNGWDYEERKLFGKGILYFLHTPQTLGILSYFYGVAVERLLKEKTEGEIAVILPREHIFLPGIFEKYLEKNHIDAEHFLVMPESPPERLTDRDFRRYSQEIYEKYIEGKNVLLGLNRKTREASLKGILKVLESPHNFYSQIEKYLESEDYRKHVDARVTKVYKGLQFVFPLYKKVNNWKGEKWDNLDIKWELSRLEKLYPELGEYNDGDLRKRAERAVERAVNDLCQVLQDPLESGLLLLGIYLEEIIRGR